ncbi:hypothetical protein AOT82_749 [Psychrobacter sp. AntiMn-1]|nr:hypothetical protein AOT82_749 [Psychrobacter sp. AntiMn-1]
MIVGLDFSQIDDKNFVQHRFLALRNTDYLPRKCVVNIN